MYNRKGINNILIIVLLILIVFAGVMMIWMYAGNTLHREGKTIENSASLQGINGKTEIKVNSTEGGEGETNDGQCRIVNVSWYNNASVANIVNQGDEVSLVVKGENCEGKTVNFDIWENDICIFGLCSDYFVDNFTVIFDEDPLAVASWKAEWLYDSLIGGNPEYFFIAKIDDFEVKSELLTVEKIESANSPPTQDCKPLAYNGKNKIDIVIFSDFETAKVYKNALISFEPMKSYSNAFNFYYIDDYPIDQACEIYKGIALLCRSKGLIKRASSCPNDYIMVVQSHPPEIRSSAFLNIMSLNAKLPEEVVMHEFGHVFASFAEEYVPAILPKDSKNCAKDENNNPDADCDRQFGSNRDGCYVECSDRNYRRSIESGVMRTLSSDRYGTFNDNLIIERLRESADLINNEGGVENVANSPIFESEIESCNKQEYYLVKGDYDASRGEIDLTKVDTYNGCIDESSNGFGGDTIEVLDDQTEEKISQTNFNAGLIFIDGNDKLNEYGESVIDGETLFNEDSFYIKLEKNDNIRLKVNLEDGRSKFYKLQRDKIELM